MIIVKKPSQNDIERLKVKTWPIWEKEESSFDWHYDSNETCYFLEGEVDIETDDGKKVNIKKGDLVTFPKGLSCRWIVKKAVRKHYLFD